MALALEPVDGNALPASDLTAGESKRERTTGSRLDYSYTRQLETTLGRTADFPLGGLRAALPFPPRD